jgi:hypothetical protein
MSKVRYRKLSNLDQIAIAAWDALCEDCGAVVVDKDAHNRFHAILGDYARALAILLVGHIGTETAHAAIYDKLTGPGRNTNNWSAEAFAEVVAGLEGEPE